MRGSYIHPLLLTVALLGPVHATITIMDSGKIFASRPEKKLGHQLWKGSDYMGRLQFVHGNLQLCKSAQEPHRRFTITESMDGLPVAIYAKAGGCSLEEKALVASTLLDPPNIVGYLIVDDEKRERRKKKTGPKGVPTGSADEGEDEDLLDDFIDETSFWVSEVNDTDEDMGDLWDELMAQVQKQPELPFELKTLAPLNMGVGMGDDAEEIETAFLLEPLITDDETAPPLSLEMVQEQMHWPVTTDDASASDDEMVSLPLERFRVQSEENVWWSGGDELQSDDGGLLKRQNRQLKHSDNDRINVAILHVSNRVGYDLLDLLLKENSEVGRLGGPKILLNSKAPNASTRTIFVWTLLSISISACACCCMLIFVDIMGEEQAHARPQQPVRRRLTNNQVREHFPAFHYHPDNHLEQPLEDECAICLDDFTEGMRLRKLPCGHVFHSTCVARWLIERSAVCPLCKMDLYIDEEEEEEDEEPPATGLPRTIASLTSSWFPSSRPATTTTTNVTTSSAWSWFGRSEAVAVAPRPVTGAAATAPTPPPARAFRWGLASRPSPTSPVNEGGQQQQQQGDTIPAVTSPTSSLAAAWASSGRWFFFARNNRRSGTGASDMLTELTEPLMPAGSSAGDEEAPASPVAAGDSGSADITASGTSTTIPSSSPTTSEEEPPTTAQGTRVEV